MVIRQILAIKQIWLKVKPVFEFTISAFILHQLIDNFYSYLAIKENLEKQKNQPEWEK